MSMRSKSVPLPRPAGRERGASDMDSIWILLVGVVVIAIGYVVLDWVKAVKDERVERGREAYYESLQPKKNVRERREVQGYQVTY